MRFWGDDTAVRKPAFAICAAFFLLLLANEAAADELAVDVVNASVSTLCAETDNVYLELISGEVHGLTIEAVHPAYAGTIVADNSAPDFRNCDMSQDQAHRFVPRRITLWETEDWQLVGHTMATFWRPNAVPVRVDNRGDRPASDPAVAPLSRARRGGSGAVPG